MIGCKWVTSLTSKAGWEVPAAKFVCFLGCRHFSFLAKGMTKRRVQWVACVFFAVVFVEADHVCGVCRRHQAVEET